VASIQSNRRDRRKEKRERERERESEGNKGRREGKASREDSCRLARHAHESFPTLSLSLYARSFAPLFFFLSFPEYHGACAFSLAKNGGSCGICISVTYRSNNTSLSKSGSRRDMFPVSRRRHDSLSSTPLSFPFALRPRPLSTSSPPPSPLARPRGRGKRVTAWSCRWSRNKVSHGRSIVPSFVFSSPSLFPLSSTLPSRRPLNKAPSSGHDGWIEGRKCLIVRVREKFRGRARDYQSARAT